MLKHRPLLLLILDGFGYSEMPDGNAIAQAAMPTWNYLWQQYPHTLISASGLDVGLPAGQMGNSEVGHLNMGAGRMVPQDLVRLNMAITDQSFFANPTLVNAVEAAHAKNKAVHILGLLSTGGVHSHEEHFMAMVRLAAMRGVQVYCHAFLDGRDTPPKSALASLQKLHLLCDNLKNARIATVAGRYYAMDRDQRWERTESAYEALLGHAEFHAESAELALAAAYERNETDEFVRPTIIGSAAAIEDGDSIIFMNFRADRARQLTSAFVMPNFTGFIRRKIPTLSAFVTLTEYASEFPVHVAYGSQNLHNVLGEYLSTQGLKQLRIAETEKYAHVTFFFNGGREQEFIGEDRILVASPKVATYDLKPEMSAVELTDKLIDAISAQKYDVIICNYANADMVGHTGIMSAAVTALETLDSCLSRIVQSLQDSGGELLLTSDHGNVEQMTNDETGQAHTAHTSNLVPLLYVGRAAELVVQDGKLTDISPTLLDIIGLPTPPEMTGRAIFKVKS